MTKEAIMSKVTDIIYGTLGVDKEYIKPESNIVEDLAADDLDCVELMMDLEEEFGIYITEDESESLKTVGEIMDYLEKKLGAE